MVIAVAGSVRSRWLNQNCAPSGEPRRTPIVSRLITRASRRRWQRTTPPSNGARSGYFDPTTGLFVMTALTLAARPCCEQGCRHCPWLLDDEGE